MSHHNSRPKSHHYSYHWAITTPTNEPQLLLTNEPLLLLTNEPPQLPSKEPPLFLPLSHYYSHKWATTTPFFDAFASSGLVIRVFRWSPAFKAVHLEPHRPQFWRYQVESRTRDFLREVMRASRLATPSFISDSWDSKEGFLYLSTYA